MSVFDLNRLEQRQTCFHWSNLFPLLTIDNNRATAACLGHKHLDPAGMLSSKPTLHVKLQMLQHSCCHCHRQLR